MSKKQKNFKSAHLLALMITTCVAQSEQNSAAAIVLIIENLTKTQVNWNPI